VRILVVDDDADFREVLAIGLAGVGHIVLQVADGVQALAYLRARPVDAVLLDLQMRGLSGEDFLAACRRTPRRASVPVALVSGREDVAAVADRLGVACLRKPVRLAEVRRLVDALATRRRGVAVGTD
jgi:DNA-binding response OmpR family regulator